MVSQLDIEDFLRLSANCLVVDVRSEGEFNYAHIPNALNLPLFNNEERAEVGTLYKQKGRNEAIQKGLELVGPKMAQFTEFVRQRITHNKVFVHCWRGGMRSSSMAWLLNLMGWEVYVLKGGYKRYRQAVLASLAVPRSYSLLGGYTGSGKTEILQLLIEQGEQVIDLEKLANHKGSAFGALGEAAQPSTEMFENRLYEEIQKMDNNRTVWLEDESKTIGTIYLNNEFLKNIKQAPLYILEIPFSSRVEKLAKEYGNFPKELLEASICKITKRLGDQNCREALEALATGDMHTTAAITLRYYDKAYQHALENSKSVRISTLQFNSFDAAAITQQLLKLHANVAASNVPISTQ